MKIFYTMPEYETWKDETNTKGWSIKYYKGLGTSTSKEAKEYFAELDANRKTFVWNGGLLLLEFPPDSLPASVGLVEGHL